MLYKSSYQFAIGRKDLIAIFPKEITPGWQEYLS
jgi:hypothetical protein